MRSFVASAVTAGLMEAISDKSVQVIRHSAALGSGTAEPEEEGEEGQQPEKDTRPKDAAYGNGGQATRVVHHVWPLEHGEITFDIAYGKPLPGKAYGQIQAVIEQGDALAATLGLSVGDRPMLPSKGWDTYETVLRAVGERREVIDEHALAVLAALGFVQVEGGLRPFSRRADLLTSRLATSGSSWQPQTSYSWTPSWTCRPPQRWRNSSMVSSPL